MTPISTTAPVTLRRFNIARISFPRREICASFAAIWNLYRDALNMAYVAPYTSLRRQPQVVPERDLEGRDPTW